MVWSYITREVQKPTKGEDLYDRNGEFVRHQDSDHLEEYNQDAYRINEHDELYDSSWDEESPTRKNLYHRLGEDTSLKTPGSAPTRLQMIHSIRSKWTDRQMF